MSARIAWELPPRPTGRRLSHWPRPFELVLSTGIVLTGSARSRKSGAVRTLAVGGPVGEEGVVVGAILGVSGCWPTRTRDAHRRGGGEDRSRKMM